MSTLKQHNPIQSLVGHYMRTVHSKHKMYTSQEFPENEQDSDQLLHFVGAAAHMPELFTTLLHTNTDSVPSQFDL